MVECLKKFSRFTARHFFASVSRPVVSDEIYDTKDSEYTENIQIKY